MRRSFASCNAWEVSDAVPAPGDDRIATPYEGVTAMPWTGSEGIPAPLRPHRVSIPRALTDYNDHLSESSYLLLIGDSADAFFRYVGIDEAYRAAGQSLFTAQTHLHHLGQAREGDVVHLTLRLLDADDRRLHLYHELLHDTELLAVAEQLLVHVDTTAGRSAPMPPDLRGRVEAVRRAHASLPRPLLLGKPLGIRRPARGAAG